MRTLIFSFDGTCNGRTDEHPTNVLKFHGALLTGNQVPFYFAGPGDETNSNWWERFAGAALGIGCKEIVDNALNAFRAAYREGDRIAVDGFSRGAANARMFCSELTKEGHEVAFLGCWDTVAAFMPFGPAQQETLFGDLHVSPLVKNAYHAVALNEDRASFEPNLMNAREGITEVWFKGNHSDVGGGYADTRNSDVALMWMIEQAELHDLVFRTLDIELDLDGGPIHREKRPRRRDDRHVGVKRDGEWTDEEAVIFAG